MAILAGDFTGAFQALNDTIRKQVTQLEVDQVFERLAVDGEKGVKLLNDTAKLNADFINKRIQMTVPPTLAAFSKLGDAVAKSTDAPDGALYKFGENISAVNRKIMKLLGLDTDEGETDTDTKSNIPIDLDDFEQVTRFNRPDRNNNTPAPDVDSGRGSGLRQPILEMQRGSNGVQDFGSGTAAILHGREAVIPEDQLTNMAKELMAFGMPVTNQMQDTTAMTSEFINALKALNVQSTNLARSPAEVGQTDLDTVQSTAQPNMLEKHIEDLNKTSVSMNQNLNTLVQLASMTERNTKNTTNNLANMSGSVV